MTGLFTHTLTLFNKRLFQITPPISERGLLRRFAFALLLVLFGSIQIAFAATRFVYDSETGITKVYDFHTNGGGVRIISLNGDGSAGNPYEIGTVDQWNAFAWLVNNAKDANENYIKRDAYAIITADITFTNNHLQPNIYSGTIDGQGHTITLHQSNRREGNGYQYFPSNDEDSWGGLIFSGFGVRIMNLRLAGEIRNNTYDCGTFIQNANGITTIENCQSSVTIIKTSGESGEDVGKYSGGMIGSSADDNSNITIKNSLVDGKFSVSYSGGANNRFNGGFMGRLTSGKYLTVRNSYAHPQTIDSKFTSFYPFCVSSGTFTNANSYYKFPDGFNVTNASGQGTTTEAPGTSPAPTTKEATATALNKNLSTPAWELHNDTIYLKTFAKYVDIHGWTYGGSPNAPTIVGNSGNGTVTYQYKVQGGTYATYTPGTTVLGAGSYTLKAIVSAVKDNSRNVIWNGWESTMDFTITPKPVTISGITASNKVYDGNSTASLNTSNASFGGLISGDALTVTASGNFSDANVGTGKNVSITMNSLGGSSANNYQLAASGHQTTTTANITKKDLTITAKNHSITYGDEPNNAGVSYTGFVNSETSTVLGGSLSYAYSYSQYGDVGNTYTITPSGQTSSNYDITFNAGTLTVEQKEVGLNWTNISFTYDKTVKTPTATATGMVNGDEIGVTVTGGQTDAGSHTATASELTGTKKGNYKLPSSKTQAFSISKAEITVSGITAENKTYDKTTNATLVYTAANLAGKIEGDNLSVSATGTFADENIGTGKNVAISALTLDGTSVGNYQLAGSGQQSYTTANITAKTVGLNWSATSFDYNGSPQAPTAEATGVIDGDVCNVTVNVEEEHTAVGSYRAEATALDNGNYALPAEKAHDYEIVRPLGIEFTASKHWNTYYAFENLATPTGLTAYIVTGVSGTAATTSEIGYIPEGVGVLLYSACAGSNFKASAYTEATGSFTSNKLNGSTSATVLASEAGYILYGDAFVLTTGGTLPANRCYLPANMGAGTRSLTIDGGDGTTSLYKVNIEEMGDDKWFDLQGQRIEKPKKKGLYIHDGKKVVIK